MVLHESEFFFKIFSFFFFLVKKRDYEKVNGFKKKFKKIILKKKFGLRCSVGGSFRKSFKKNKSFLNKIGTSDRNGLLAM
jgi:hypothetical protein